MLRKHVPTLIRFVALYRSAMKIASKVWWTAVGQVNRTSIVPENQIVVLPAVPIDESGLRAMAEKEHEKLATLRLRQVENAGCEALVHNSDLRPG